MVDFFQSGYISVLRLRNNLGGLFQWPESSWIAKAIITSQILYVKTYVFPTHTKITANALVYHLLSSSSNLVSAFYATSILQIKNTYYVPMNDTLPGSDGIPTPDHSGAEEIPYYQWVPIILAFMIFTFAIPGLSPPRHQDNL